MNKEGMIRECERMPFDRNGLHATGYQMFSLGVWWNEYWNPETEDYEYLN